MEIITEALIDTAKLVPFLAAIYFVVGFLEYRYGDRTGHVLRDLGALGPIVGALLGCIPQCGFSVVASALYVKRGISAGTLLAVFLSTSDEAVPVLLSMPDKARMVGVLIAIKLVIAIAAGVGLDYLMRVCQARRSKAAIRQSFQCGCGQRPRWLLFSWARWQANKGAGALSSSAPAHRENIPIPAAADSCSKLHCAADGT